MALSKDNIYTIGKYKYFEVFGSSPFKDEYIKAINSRYVKESDKQFNIDGLLIENKGWYDGSNLSSFDPRLYIVMRGFDGDFYAISFRDNQRASIIERYEGSKRVDFVETKILKADSLIDDYVVASVSNVSKSLSPYDPLNIYKIDHKGELSEADKAHVYGVEYGSFNGLKLMIAINKLRTQGVKKIVISSDSVGIEKLILFYMKTFTVLYNTKSTYVPQRVNTYSPYVGDLIVCSSLVSREFEKNGYQLLELNSKENAESIMKIRMERRDKYDRH